MNNIHRWAIMPTCTVVRVHWCMHPCTCTALALCHCTCSISNASRHLSGYEGNFGINFVSLSGVVFLTLLLCTVYVGKYLLGKMYSMQTQFYGHAHSWRVARIMSSLSGHLTKFCTCTIMQVPRYSLFCSVFFARFHQHQLHYKHREASIVPLSLKKSPTRGAAPLIPSRRHLGIPQTPKFVHELHEDLPDCPGYAPGDIIVMCLLLF